MSRDSLTRILETLPSRALSDALGDVTLDGLEELVGSAASLSSDPRALARLVAIVKGDQVFETPQIRFHLLSTLSPQELSRLAADLCGRAFPKPADNALALASLPWKHGAPITLECVRLLGMPTECLPRAPAVVPTSTIIRRCEAQAPLRDYQEDVRSQILAQLSSGVSRVLIQMPTGSGKTRTVMEAVVDLSIARSVFVRDRCVLWLAHMEELCEQAVGAFESAWRQRGDGDVGLTRAWGAFKPSIEDYQGTFVVGTFQKFAALRKGSPLELAQIRDRVALVVVDEAHKALAPTFEAVIEELLAEGTPLLGLTATPGRGLSQGTENVRLASMFGKNLISPGWSSNPIRELRDRGILATVVHRAIESGTSLDLSGAERSIAIGGDLPGSVLSRLASSADRNRKIIDAVREQVRHARACLLFACSVEHSRLLAAALTVAGVNAAHLDATVSKYRRKEIIASLREGALDVVLNYSVLSTGLDIPRLSAIVVARPTTSVVLYSQMIGRGLRGPASGGSSRCYLIDVRDNFRNFGAVDDVYEAFAPYWDTSPSSLD
jgi:DNA repair protein RadD